MSVKGYIYHIGVSFNFPRYLLDKDVDTIFRVFENNTKSFRIQKEKYPVVYENQTLFVCKIHGSQEVLTFYKDSTRRKILSVDTFNEKLKNFIIDKFNDLLYPKTENSFEYYSAYVFLTNEENKKYFKKYKVSDDKGNEAYRNNDFIKELINNYCSSFNSTYKQELLKEKKEKIIDYCKNEIDTLNRSKAMSITSINNSIYLYERDLKNAKDKLERKSAEFDKKINKLNSIMEYLKDIN